MINKELVRSAVEKRICNQLFFSIVNECFMKALPINKTEITQKESKDLQKYSWSVLQSIGGIGALESAVDFNKKSLQQNIFIGQIYETCMESAKVARRKTDEIVENDPTQTLKSVVDKTALTDEEYKKFTKKKESLNLDEVSDIIKKKTLNVIKDEQEQYEKEQELDRELKDALDNDDIDDNQDMEELSNESLINIYLDKSAPRHHISIFSKLQETAMEMMSIIKVDNEEDYMPIVMKTTFESFLKDTSIPDLNKAMEAINKITQEEVCEIPNENRPKIATLVSIIVYTMMETLKTMGIYCPTQSEIQNFVNRPIDIKSTVSHSINECCDNIKCVVKEASSVDLTKLNSQDLSNKMIKLKSANEMAESLVGQVEDNVELLNLVCESNKYITKISEILHQRNIDAKAKTSATESFNSKRQKSNDIAQFNRINSMFGSNPLINEIILKVNPDNYASIIDVQCANESGQIIKTSYMNMEYVCEASQYSTYLKDTFDKSNLSSTEKKVSVIINDGKGIKNNFN